MFNGPFFPVSAALAAASSFLACSRCLVEKGGVRRHTVRSETDSSLLGNDSEAGIAHLQSCRFVIVVLLLRSLLCSPVQPGATEQREEEEEEKKTVPDRTQHQPQPHRSAYRDVTYASATHLSGFFVPVGAISTSVVLDGRKERRATKSRGKAAKAIC